MVCNCILYVGQGKRKRREMEKVEMIGIPTDEAMQLLRKGGLDVSREETELIMEFLVNLTKLVLEKYVKPP